MCTGGDAVYNQVQTVSGEEDRNFLIQTVMLVVNRIFWYAGGAWRCPCKCYASYTYVKPKIFLNIYVTALNIKDFMRRFDFDIIWIDH